MPIRRAKKDPITEAPELTTVREAQAAYAQAEPFIRQFIALGQLLAFAQKAVDQTEEAKKQHATLGPEVDRLKETSVDLRDELDGLRDERQRVVQDITDLKNDLAQRQRNFVSDVKALEATHAAALKDARDRHEEALAELHQQQVNVEGAISDAKAELEELKDEQRRLVARFA